jgi:uncharacterized protein
MGEYSDYVMSDDAGTGTAGVCHSRGANTGIPPQWIIYFVVADIAASIASVLQLGGAVITEPRNSGGGTFSIIRDPAGAVCALYQGQP